MTFMTGQSWCVLKSCLQVGAQNKDFGAVLQKDWTRVMWRNIIGRDPFNQKFRKLNFGPKLNGSVRSSRKSFEKTGEPFKVDHIARSDRSDRKMTCPFDHSDSFSFSVSHGSVHPWCLPVEKWRLNMT